jgi:tripartite-type tricarboxylate transporter receptor subunit TctC
MLGEPGDAGEGHDRQVGYTTRTLLAAASIVTALATPAAATDDYPSRPGPAAIDVVAGKTKAVMNSTSTLSPHVRAGKLRGIDISSRARLPSMPEVPTFIEAGFPQYEAGNWIGFAVPAGKPREAAKGDRRDPGHARCPEAVREPRRDRREDDGRQFGAHIDAELAKWGKVVRDAKVKAE